MLDWLCPRWTDEDALNTRVMASYVNEIKAIQKAVGSTADGIWGPKTLAAVASKLGCAATVKDIQKKVGVTADGLLGPKTYAAIVSKLVAKVESASAVSPLVQKYIDKPIVYSKVDYKVKTLPRQAEVRSGKSVFGKAGNENDLVSVPVPAGYPMKYGCTPVKTIRCHKLVADRLEAALKDIYKHYGSDIATVAPGACLYDGCFNNRNTRNGTSTSVHAWGIAIDFDAGNNALNTHSPKARLSQPVYKPFLKILEHHGFLSLGFRNDKDWMHVQCCRWDS